VTARRGTIALPALGIGLVVALSVPPAGWWPLGILGLAALGHLLSGRPVRARATAGFVAGLGLYGVTLFWMGQFNAIGAFLVMGLEASFLMLAAVTTPPGLSRVWAWPAAVLVSNALRTVIPFGGLPMGGIELGQAAGPLAAAARVGGPLVVAALVAVAGVGLEAVTFRRWTIAAISAALVVAVPALGAAAPDGAVVGRLRTAMVQGGGRRGLRAVNNPPELVYGAQLAADASVSPPVDLVVWPENVIALDGPIAGSPQDAEVGAEAHRLGATLVAGVTEPVGDTRFANAAVAWAPTGQIEARYDKVHRVPFGEYVPGRSLVAHIVNLGVIPRDAVAGHGPGLLRTSAGPLGVTISFEVFFSSRARAAIRAGGQVLLVPTNTASYTTSQVPDSEVAAAKLRAWETGRDVVMAAPTGFSAAIDAHGRVLARTGLGHRQVLLVTVARRHGTTPYLRLGDGPFVALALALVGLAWAWERLRST